MTDSTYNGWTNYATWGVALVLDNAEGTQSYVDEMAAELRDDASSAGQVTEGVWTEAQYVRYQLADRIKDFTEQLCGLDDELGLPEPSLVAQQLLGAALSDVNWDEIAENKLSALVES